MIRFRFNVPTKDYFSVDTVYDRKETIHYPTEFLNSLTSPRTLSHKLIIKVGSPPTLLQNLYQPKLCLQIKSLKNCYLNALLLLTGDLGK